MASWLNVTLVLYALEPAPRFGLRHPFSQALITVYKSMTGSAFDYASKLWHFPFEMRDEVLRRVRAVRGTEIEDLPSFVTAFLNSVRKSAALNGGGAAGGATAQPQPSRGDDAEMEEEIKHRMESIPEALWATLYPFQVECVRFAIRRRGKILLGDEMGLGKTLQALAVACAYREDWPVLVVAPSSLRRNWQNEAIKWVPGLTTRNTQIVKDAKAGVSDDALMVIVSYELASRMVDNSMLWKGQFQVVVADESHYLKSVDAKRSQAIVPLMQQAARAMCVTGTPALSRPAELFMQINALLPKAFPSFHPFAVRYCAAHQGPFGLDVSGSSNTGELKMLLEHTVMIRRLKEEVLSDMLPEKDRQVVDVPCDQELMKEVDELLGQKEEIEKALNSTDDDFEKLRLRGMQQGVTSQLYCTSGRAKVKGVLAHLKTLLTDGTRDISKADDAIDDHHDGQKKPFFPLLPSGPSSPRGSPSPSQGRLSAAGASAIQRNRTAESNAMFTESGSGEWACMACTFLNPGSERKCDLCENPRPRKERTGPATAPRGAKVRDRRCTHGSSVAEKDQDSIRRQREATRVDHVKDETDSSLDDSDVAANSVVNSKCPGTKRGRENVAVEGASRGGGGSDGGDFKGLRGARLRRRAYDREDGRGGEDWIGGAGKKRISDEDDSGGGSSSEADFDVRAGESKSRIRKRAVLSSSSDSAGSSMTRLGGTSTTAERLRTNGRREKSTVGGTRSDEDDSSSGREGGALLIARHGSKKRGREKISQSRAADNSLGVGQTVAPTSRRRTKFSGKAGRRQGAGSGSGGGSQRFGRSNNRYGDQMTSSDSDFIESALGRGDDEEYVPGEEDCGADDDDDDDDHFVPSTTRRGADSKISVGKKAAVVRGTGKGNGRVRGEVQTTRACDSGVVVEGGKSGRVTVGDGCTGGQGTGKGQGKGKRGQEPRKLVVFAHHKDVMDTLERGLGEMGIESVRIDGSTMQNKRQPIVDRFQAEPNLSVILLAITAAGVGITLTAASCAVFAELYWTPGSMAQAEDRIHRIGQVAKTVLIQYMVGRGTMDDTMLSSIHRKQSTLKSTVGLNRDAGGYSNVPGREHRLLSPGHTPSPSRQAASRAILPADASQRKLDFAPVSHQQPAAAAVATGTGMSVSSGSKSKASIEATFGLSRESDAAAMPNLGRRQRSPPPSPPPPSTGTQAADEVVDLSQSSQQQQQESQHRAGKPPLSSPQSFRETQRVFLAGTAAPSPAAAAAAAAAANPRSEITAPSSLSGAGTNTSVAWSARFKPTGVTAAIAPGPDAGGKGVTSAAAARGAAGDRKLAEGGLSVEIQERIARNRQMALQKLAEKKRQRELQYQQQHHQRHQQPQQQEYPCAPGSLSQGSVNGYPPRPRPPRSLFQGDNGRNVGLRLTPVLHGHQEQRQQQRQERPWRQGAATTAPGSPASRTFPSVGIWSTGSPQRPVAASTSAIATATSPSSLSSSTSLTGVSKRGTPSAEGRASTVMRSTSRFQQNSAPSQAHLNGLRRVVGADIVDVDVESSAKRSDPVGPSNASTGVERNGSLRSEKGAVGKGQTRAAD